MRTIAIVSLLAILPGFAGCGYHTLGAATHLPPDVRTLSVPVFATRTEAYHTEVLMTNAVIREFAARTRMRITPDSGADADAVLHGTILTQTVSPLTYNTNHRAVLQLPDHARGFGHIDRIATARFSTKTRTTRSATSTSPPSTFPPSSMRARGPRSVSPANLRGRSWPTFWKGCSDAQRGGVSIPDHCSLFTVHCYSGPACSRHRYRASSLRERRTLGCGVHRRCPFCSGDRGRRSRQRPSQARLRAGG